MGVYVVAAIGNGNEVAFRQGVTEAFGRIVRQDVRVCAAHDECRHLETREVIERDRIPVFVMYLDFVAPAALIAFRDVLAVRTLRGDPIRMAREALRVRCVL